MVIPRGDLAEAEAATIAIFEQVSPSVVQVLARTAAGGAPSSLQSESGMQTGTGFVWDEAGHVVTNNHVVEGASEVYSPPRFRRSGARDAGRHGAPTMILR